MTGSDAGDSYLFACGLSLRRKSRHEEAAEALQEAKEVGTPHEPPEPCGTVAGNHKNHYMLLKAAAV